MGIIRLVLAAIAGIMAVWMHELSKTAAANHLLHPLYADNQKQKIKLWSMIDPIGLILFLFTGVLWQKPVQYQYGRFKDKKNGMIGIVVAGYVGSMVLLLVGVGIGILIKNLNLETGTVVKSLHLFAILLMHANFSVMLVNLLPIPPLDMTLLIRGLNPEAYHKIMTREHILKILFILAVAFGLFTQIINILFKLWATPLL